MRAVRWSVEAAACALAYLAFVAVDGSARGSVVAAFRDAHGILAVERALGLTRVEAVLRTVAPPSPVTSVLYVGLHFVGTLAVGLWLRVRRVQLWRVHRWSLVWLAVVAVAVAWVFPVAPPWALGVRDAAPWLHAAGAASGLNLLAAFPSLHVAVAVWVALVGVRAGWSRWVYLYPVFVAVLVVSTGNHYVLDAAAGVVLAWGAVVGCEAVSTVEGVKKWLQIPQRWPLSAPPPVA